jgi:hypothetical protein
VKTRCILDDIGEIKNTWTSSRRKRYIKRRTKKILYFRVIQRAMRVEGKHGSRLGCIVLLFASCLSFQTNLPIIHVTRSGWRSQSSSSSSSSSSWQSDLLPSSSSSSSSSSSRQIRRTVRNYLVPYDPSSSAYNLSEKMSNGTSSNLNSSNDANNISINDNIENGSSSNNFVQDKTSTYTLGISRHYFDEMEERSGKDYRWIKPLTKPVSQVMM